MKRDIGDILLSTGAINTQQLEECRRAVSEQGTTVEQCLMATQAVTLQSIAKAYAQYASLEYLETIIDKMADTDLMSKVPLKFLRDHVVIPIKLNDQITIITANPLDFQPLDELNML